MAHKGGRGHGALSYSYSILLVYRPFSNSHNPELSKLLHSLGSTVGQVQCPPIAQPASQPAAAGTHSKEKEQAPDVSEYHSSVSCQPSSLSPKRTYRGEAAASVTCHALHCQRSYCMPETTTATCFLG